MKTASKKAKPERLPNETSVKFEKAITINRPIKQVYWFWRNLENLPAFIYHLVSVRVETPTLSHWRARQMDNVIIEWETEIVMDRPEEIITWRSRQNNELQNIGTVLFNRAPGERGTVVKFTTVYSPSGGKWSATLNKLFGKDPGLMLTGDLFRLKSIMETGEAPTIDGQPRGNNKKQS